MNNSPTDSSTSSYMQQLDGLRALAVLGVLISHFSLGKQLEWFADSLPWGHLGVRLFFVVSGFLITGILLDRRTIIDEGLQTKSNALLLFYGRRFLRIFPIFYLTILVAFYFDCGNMREIAKYHILYLSNFENVIYSDFSFSSSQHTLRDPTSAHFWSLAVEEQFYLIWPALVLYLRSNTLIKVIFGMIFLAPIWRFFWFLFSPQIPSSSLLACLDSLGVGAFLAVYIRRGHHQLTWILKYHRLILTIATVILILACAAHMADLFYRPRRILLDIGESIVFGFIVIHYSTNRNDIIAKILQFSPLQFIGKISYGIYIYHPFMSPLQFNIWQYFGLSDISGSSLHSLILAGMTLVVAMISWFLIETPINQLKRYIPRGPGPSL